MSDAVKGFPIIRVLIAGLIIPSFPLLAVFVANQLSPTPMRESFTLAESLLVFPVYAALSWPGYVVFFLLGVPTIYLLYRWNHFGFIIFGIFGALYTCLGVYFAIDPYPNQPERNFEVTLGLAPIFGWLGALAGVLTRLIVFGPGSGTRQLLTHADRERRPNEK